MHRSDWIGLSASLLLHGGLAALFAVLTTSTTTPKRLGYVEVEFGEFSSGQPVESTEQVEKTTAPEAQEEAPEPETDPKTSSERPETEPVDLPEEEQQTEETVPPTEKETTTPEAEAQPETEQKADQQKPSPEPGTEESGEPGTGTQEEASAPYDIEGLDRDPQVAPLPEYVEKVNAQIKVQITVNPKGRIVKRIPLRKDNPRLEAAVMDALHNWRFNALPPGAPQKNQTGTITFTFRVE